MDEPTDSGPPRNEGRRPLRSTDLAALTVGFALASVHLEGLAASTIGDAGLVPGLVVLLILAGLIIGLTASGPFLMTGPLLHSPGSETVRERVETVPDLARREATRRDRPGVGEWLWTLLGLPWVLGAGAQLSGAGPDAASGSAYAFFFAMAWAVVLIAVNVIAWPTLISSSSEDASVFMRSSWTNRVGCVLALIWPLQCGLALLTVSP